MLSVNSNELHQEQAYAPTMKNFVEVKSSRRPLTARRPPNMLGSQNYVRIKDSINGGRNNVTTIDGDPSRATINNSNVFQSSV